ncbi:hypothetical protein [Rickettsia hoogstraalii]|uniref:hypothetical protein n=1 Tax=Rickettsia hoogstraalii TaxID=467174 RepID=UPI001E4F6311|nr:hypothetical protein [Rickettsia hoogstraalii]
MSILRVLTATPKSIFSKLTYKYDLATTIRAYNAVNISLDEAFKTSLQNNSYKTAKLLLSSGQLNLNYRDAEGNSVLMNILQSQNTPLLKNYFSKAKVETDFKLFPLIPNNSGHTIYEIAAVADNKKISKILYHKIAELHDLNKIVIQASANKIDSNTLDLDSPPPYNLSYHDDATHMTGEILEGN